MSAVEAKVRCPKCHGRFFVPLAEIGRDGLTPCPNCGTSIHVKTKTDAAQAPTAHAPTAAPGREAVADASRELAAAPQAPEAAPATAPPTTAAGNAAPPWWKFWAR